MKKRNQLFLFSAAFLLLMLLQSVPTQASTAKISNTSKYLLAGEEFKLTINNNSRRVTWSSNRRSVARVNSQTGKVTAVSAGTAVITGNIGKQKFKCTVYVKDTVDILVFAGQSNMTGNGDASRAPKLKKGAGYAFNYVTNPRNFESLREPFGYGQDDDCFENKEYARGSLVTAFVNAYYTNTNTPVIAVPASRVGTGSVFWKNTGYEGIIKRTNAAVSLAKKNKLHVRHVYLVWMQGETDAFAYMSGKEHTKNLQSMFKKIKKKTRIEKCLLIGIPSFYGDKDPASIDKDVKTNYKKIQKAQTALCDTGNDFILISTKASRLSKAYLRSDGIHLTQKALNLVGTNAGKNAGAYAKSN